MTTVQGIEGFALTLAAPAKINLALHVVGQRADGYHLLESLVTFADAGDRIGFVLCDEDRFTLSGAFSTDLPLTGDAAAGNLVLKARDLLRAFLADRGIEAGPVHLHLEKNLPIASGIGGGSADAAATLRGLLQLWGASVDHEALQRIALKLGADVPMCLDGRPLIAKGIGDEILAVAGLPAFPMLIVNPLKGVSTPTIFRLLTNKTNPPLFMADAVELPDHAFHDPRNRGDFPPSVPSGHLPLKGGDRTEAATRPISPLEGEMSATPTEGGSPPRSPSRSNGNPTKSRAASGWIDYLKTTRNDLEPPARSIEPEIKAVSDALSTENALFSRMSGSGATCFGLFATAEDRDRASASLSSLHPNWYVLACSSIGGEDHSDGRHG